MRLIVASALMIPLALMGGASDFGWHYSLNTWVLIIAAAVLSTGCGYLLYYKGLAVVNVSTTAFLELITPVAALLLGLSFLHETLTLTQGMAIPVLLYAVYKIAVLSQARK